MVNYWLCITSYPNWLICKEKNLWGVRDREETSRVAYGLDQLENCNKSDIFIFHAKSHGISAIFEVTSDVFTDNKPIWHDGIYSRRVQIKSIDIFDTVGVIPWREIDGKIENTKTGTPLVAVSLQGKSMIPIDKNDFEFIKSLTGKDFEYKSIEKLKKNTYERLPHREKIGISETNLESILAERLDDLEDGLILIKRQYDTKEVGRMDLLCKDKNSNFVVIELKKFKSTHSIIDQICRYTGWVKRNLAKEGQNVRGIIVVAKKDKNLDYAVDMLSNVEVKTFKLSIE